MFDAPEGWTSHAADDVAMIYPPGGPTVGHVRGRTGLPLSAQVAELVVRHLGEVQNFSVGSDPKPEMMTTAEGEFAALVTIEGRLLDVPAQCTLGFVFGDDTYTCLNALVTVQDEFATFSSTVRTLVTNTKLGLGTRARRFLYRPPVAWHGLQNGANATWYPPAFPLTAATLTVPPADPHDGTGIPQHVYDAIAAADAAAGFLVEKASGPEPVQSSHGLAGSAWSILGVPRGSGRICRDIVVLGDGGYVYTFILTTTDPQIRLKCLPVLTLLIGSVHGVPAAQ